jgi:hypothetical protein
LVIVGAIALGAGGGVALFIGTPLAVYGGKQVPVMPAPMGALAPQGAAVRVEF